MASFTAAGTAYANYGVPMIPFFIYYSMFGFQRVGDLIWAFADSRGKGFLMGGTAGRTTLLGRRIAASGWPQPRAFEHRSDLRQLRSGVRLRDRSHRPGRHPPHVSGDGRPLLLPDGLQRKLRAAAHARRRSFAKAFCRACTHISRPRAETTAVQLFGSGPILNEALKAQKILAEKYQVASRCLERDQLQRAASRRAWKWSAGIACIRPIRAQAVLAQVLEDAEARSSRPPIT